MPILIAELQKTNKFKRIGSDADPSLLFDTMFLLLAIGVPS
ncbi:hypothetical protein J699_03335 [Acinetobacter sp. 1000160]|nr:hypothetical protein ACINWC323_0855 [Acinetobacter sp. WC-323]EXB25808.1 hypothetical protein J537_2512 [Acinetobacter baumannii 1437282]EXB49659.1 hypothetical protein J522_1244 [Acinetobacter baumannii 146457]EYT15829.1 hypothetical protein J699_03335 [Acinetobacter sp. 1000160]